MTIQEAISAVRNCEIVCRGSRYRSQELLALLSECEAKFTQEPREVPPVNPHAEELSAVKEELYGITSENVKYRNAIDALMGFNGELKRYVVKLLETLGKFKRAVSVSPSLFKDYEVDTAKVLEAFRTMPNLAATSPQLREFLAKGVQEVEKGDSEAKKEDSETVRIG